MRLLAEWFWTDRWERSSASALPLEARGLYREMLSRAWARGAQLPSDPAKVRRIVGATLEEWKRAWPLVSPYWQKRNGLFVNETQLDIYAEAKRLSEFYGDRAKQAAAARWGNGKNV